MTQDIETRLRAADPSRDDSPDHCERDRSWLAAQIRAAHTASGPRPPWRGPHARRTAAAAAAATAAVAAGFVVADLSGLSGPVGPTDREPTTGEPMELALAPDSPGTASCVPFSVETLRAMPVAFSGTVAEDDGEQVLIDVDRWYQGGDADQVRLIAPDASLTSLGGIVDFEEGGRYLVTAGSGVVSYCGFTGPWTPRLADAFGSAFVNE